MGIWIEDLCGYKAATDIIKFYFAYDVAGKKKKE